MGKGDRRKIGVTSRSYRVRVGGRIRRTVESSGMTPDEVSRAIQVSPETLYSWYKGNRTPSSSNAVLLSDILGCSIDYLLCRDTAEARELVAGVASAARREGVGDGEQDVEVPAAAPPGAVEEACLDVPDGGHAVAPDELVDAAPKGVGYLDRPLE